MLIVLITQRSLWKSRGMMVIQLLRKYIELWTLFRNRWSVSPTLTGLELTSGLNFLGFFKDFLHENMKESIGKEHESFMRTRKNSIFVIQLLFATNLFHYLLINWIMLINVRAQTSSRPVLYHMKMTGSPWGIFTTLTLSLFSGKFLAREYKLVYSRWPAVRRYMVDSPLLSDDGGRCRCMFMY